MSDKDAASAKLRRVPLPTIPLVKTGLGDATIADELLDSFGADADKTER